MDKRVWLIQRLTKPWKVEGDKNKLLRAVGECFSFGGGYVNVGFTKQAMDLLRPIFGFDYMGSAEFEWGAVPKALAKIVEEIGTFTDFEIQIDMKNVRKSWDKKQIHPKGIKPVYLFCRGSEKDWVEKTVRQLAKDEGTLQLKEHCGLSDVLNPNLDRPPRTGGWLELEAGPFMFFTDKEMFEQTINLLKPPVEKGASA